MITTFGWLKGQGTDLKEKVQEVQNNSTENKKKYSGLSENNASIELDAMVNC